MLVGGTLLLTPGFVTDVVGFFVILPPTRPLARKASAGSWPGGQSGWSAGGPAGRPASGAQEARGTQEG